jgi:hypothetical protein
MKLLAIGVTLASLSCSNCNQAGRTADCREFAGQVVCTDETLSILPAGLAPPVEFVEAVNYHVFVQCTLTEQGRPQACAAVGRDRYYSEDALVGSSELDHAIANTVQSQRYKPPVTNGKARNVRLLVTATLGHSAGFEEEAASAERAIFTELARSMTSDSAVSVCLAIAEDLSIPVPLASIPVVRAGGVPIASPDECRQLGKLGKENHAFLVVNQILWTRVDAATAKGRYGSSGSGGAYFLFALNRTNDGWSVRVTGEQGYVE